MKIQLALDRMNIIEAIHLTKQVEHYIDWIEVGTSLIKEYGIESIKKIKQTFPNKVIVADIKTIDNARYEFEMCFNAGADIATVMGVSHPATIEACLEVARLHNKIVMIDLLGTSNEQKNILLKYQDTIFINHIGKDEQEDSNIPICETLGYGSSMNNSSLKIAVAGGINFESLEIIKRTMNPSVVIIGSAISKAVDPTSTAAKFKKCLNDLRVNDKYE